MNLYTFPKSTLEGFIFHADQVIFDAPKLKQSAVEVLAYLKEHNVHMAVYSENGEMSYIDNPVNDFEIVPDEPQEEIPEMPFKNVDDELPFAEVSESEEEIPDFLK